MRSQLPLALLGLLALLAACGGESTEAPPAEAPAPPPAAEAPAPEPAPEEPGPAAEAPAPGPVVARTVTRDGEVFEAEYGKEGQLPSGFPDDVPLYGNARPLSSMKSVEHGSIVNLRSADPPEAVFSWYQTHYVEQGWEIEKALQERGRGTLVARKGNRVSSVVIMGVPGATQALLSVREDR